MPRTAVLCILGLSLTGCAAGQGGMLATARARQVGMSCAEANRVGRGALLRMGYVVDQVRPAKADMPGQVTAHKGTGWTPRAPEAGAEYEARVDIRCSDRGAEFDASTTEPLLERLGFGSRFPDAVAAVASRRVERPRLAERAPTELSISVEPQATLGVTPAGGEHSVEIRAVQIRIENHTQRTYGFQADEVQLITEEGSRLSPIGAGQIARRLEGAATAERLIEGDSDLSPGQSLSGHMYFPAAAYRRAKILMIDRETGEKEGFAVEF